MSTSIFFLLLVAWYSHRSESACERGCDLALGSYYLSPGLNLSFIYNLFGISSFNEIQPYNPAITNEHFFITGSRLNISFPCACINGDFLGHAFTHVAVEDETYERIVADYYANLTTVDLLARSNSYPDNRVPKGRRINVTVICSCGNQLISMDYGLFVTYPLRAGDSLKTLATGYGFSGDEDLLQRYNPERNFSAGGGIVFIPTKDSTGSYHPLSSRKTSGLSGGAIVGIVVAGAVGILVSVCLFLLLYRRKKAKHTAFPELQFESNSNMLGHGITVEKSVEFSYEELAKATNDFNLSNKIGEGGFGAVYYAELRGEKAAIKKMDMQASREFLAELKVLTHVHHLNLVRLIGYCTENSLFLVYEYIENGNLNQHLRGSGDPLPWSARVQIALDSARGLEYIHEHTVPIYIHRDIKSANILIDKNFHAKVADFGLAKLTETGTTSLPVRLAGTFGYMPPEYGHHGDFSPKVDVFAFGVVLYELISAKAAIVVTNESATESKALVALFESALKLEEPMEALYSLVDARLDDNYQFESLLKMAQLARACTQENPQLRPSMRSIVVALMTLSSNEDSDMGSFFENKAHGYLMLGR